MTFLRGRLKFGAAYAGGRLAVAVASAVQRVLVVLSPQKLKTKKNLLIIEAGQAGWRLIEYEELLASAQEFYGVDKVRTCSIKQSGSYFWQARASIVGEGEHYRFVDPRTGSQNWLIGLAQSLLLGFVMARHGVTPIVSLTDFPIMRHRVQAAVISAYRGVVCTLIDPPSVGKHFPHARLVGPMPMAISRKTTDDLGLRVAPILRKKFFESPQAIFAGSLYEPRTSLLKEIQSELLQRELQLTIVGREMGSTRRPSSEYWEALYSNAVVISTADHRANAEREPGYIRHLVYRYSEALAGGALLIGQPVPGIARFFVAGEHFLSFYTAEEAAERVEWAFQNPAEAAWIAERGHSRLRQLADASIYWQMVTSGL